MLVMNLFYIQDAQSDLSPKGFSAATKMSFSGRKEILGLGEDQSR